MVFNDESRCVGDGSVLPAELVDSLKVCAKFVRAWIESAIVAESSELDCHVRVVFNDGVIDVVVYVDVFVVDEVVDDVFVVVDVMGIGVYQAPQTRGPRGGPMRPSINFLKSRKDEKMTFLAFLGGEKHNFPVTFYHFVALLAQ